MLQSSSDTVRLPPRHENAAGVDETSIHANAAQLDKPDAINAQKQAITLVSADRRDVPEPP